MRQPRARTASCAGTSITAGMPRPTASPSRTSPARSARPCCRSCCRRLETPRALGLAVLAEHNKEVAIRTHSQLPPGVQLHLLTIGISAYNEDYAKNLRLHYADRDAHDLASAIVNTQERPLLARGRAGAAGQGREPGRHPARAPDAAHGDGTRRRQRPRGGALLRSRRDGRWHAVSAARTRRMRATPSASRRPRCRSMLSKASCWRLAKHGRVLVLLDACHSGATTLDGSAQAVDAAALRRELAAANVTVLTSSGGSEAFAGGRSMAARRVHPGAARCA